jgi:hypothetical protein
MSVEVVGVGFGWNPRGRWRRCLSGVVVLLSCCRELSLVESRQRLRYCLNLIASRDTSQTEPDYPDADVEPHRRQDRAVVRAPRVANRTRRRCQTRKAGQNLMTVVPQETHIERVGQPESGMTVRYDTVAELLPQPHQGPLQNPARPSRGPENVVHFTSLRVLKRTATNITTVAGHLTSNWRHTNPIR